MSIPAYSESWLESKLIPIYVDSFKPLAASIRILNRAGIIFVQKSHHKINKKYKQFDPKVSAFKQNVRQQK
jgi:hypothetical protein